MIDILEKFAPPHLALPDDPVGLQVGNGEETVKDILVVLDVGPSEVEEACRSGANLIISHHPFLYTPLGEIDFGSPKGSLIKTIIHNNINIYVAHTNLDVAPGGVNSLLADLLELEEVNVLDETGRERLLKLAVFVPYGHEDTVRNSLAEAGAGWIGRYSHCTFQGSGTGTFLPLEGTDPFIGKKGRIEKVDEYRLETVLPVGLKKGVLQALMDSHPYEEVAYDLYPLENEGMPLGLGCRGFLKEAVSLDQLARRCKKLLKVEKLRVAGDLNKAIKMVALCGGKGGALVEKAARAGAEVFISGDLTYHDLRIAGEWDLAVIDAGHFGTEHPIIPRLAGYLRKSLIGLGYPNNVNTMESVERELNRVVYI